MDLIGFYIFGAIAVLASLGVIGQRNPMHSVMLLIVSFGALAGLYILLDAPFTAVTQIIIYAGAIMVLFLFVIMLLNLGAPQILHEKWDFKRPAGIVLALVFAGLIAGQILPSLMSASRPVSNPALDAYGSPQAIGRTLFSTYVFPFEAVSILLLIGIVGSILLAKRRI